MLLSSVIIILREVLEAVLIISVFLVFSRVFQFSRRWLISAVILGFMGAVVYAFSIDWLSDLMDGVGQEVTNAVLQLSLYGLLLIFNVAVMVQHKRQELIRHILLGCIIASVILAITREGSEILLYVFGFVYAPDHLASVLIGSAIGAGIGLSIGIVFYYVLANVPESKLLPVGTIIIILIGAGMVSQATQQFIQADILPSQSPLWDSSNWIPEQSVVGQLLYALIGYEATPTLLQVLFYFSSIALMMLSKGLVIWCKSRSTKRL